MKVIEVMKKIITGILGIVFFVFALSMTILLLSYNDYGISQFGNKSLILMTDKIYSENYDKGDLVVVENRGFTKGLGYADKVEVGDEIFAVRVDAYGNTFIEIGTVGKLYPDENAISFENGSTFDIKFVLGEAVEKYSKIGGFLSITTSKWGFLFLVLVPCFLIFIYEIYSLIIEIKYGDEED
ncbi:MAG: hypothetical protein IJ399_01150 [Bacilli bacterium]|nr:hypothetical protein [Bacilli bacterium]